MLKNYELKEIEEKKGSCFNKKIYEIINFNNDYDKLEQDIEEYNKNCDFWLSMKLGNKIDNKQTIELWIDHLD